MVSGKTQQRWFRYRSSSAEPNALLETRVPILIWSVLVLTSTMILQTLRHPLLIQSILFTGLFVLHISLHWHSRALTKKRPWIYFIFQGLLVYACAFLMPDGYSAILLGLYPVLIGQSVGVYYERSKIIILLVCYYVLFFLAVFLIGKANQLTLFLLLFVLMMVVVVSYAVLLFRQVHARIRTQTFLGELEQAHRKVEELTLANERQRMARDLHDTLAQGLAGLIMQLEAVDAHLSKGNANRAHEIVQQSMVRARGALAEARRAIDNLRSKSIAMIGFAEAASDETDRFSNATGIPVFLNIGSPIELSKLVTEHVLHMIRESLTNVARHAEAQHVWVTINERGDRLFMEIKDDGKGFDTNLSGLRSGHYGLIGIQERVRIIGGGMTINSTKQGTVIQIEAPLGAGDQS